MRDFFLHVRRENVKWLELYVGERSVLRYKVWTQRMILRLKSHQTKGEQQWITIGLLIVHAYPTGRGGEGKNLFVIRTGKEKKNAAWKVTMVKRVNLDECVSGGLLLEKEKRRGGGDAIYWRNFVNKVSVWNVFVPRRRKVKSIQLL